MHVELYVMKLRGGPEQGFCCLIKCDALSGQTSRLQLTAAASVHVTAGNRPNIVALYEKIRVPASNRLLETIIKKLWNEGK